MKSQTHKGILVKWKDDQGFGFIKSETEEKEVFIHISAIPKQSRRPQLGDTIIYQLKLENNGKLSAKSASIQGVSLKPLSNKNQKIKQEKNNLFPKFISVILIISIGAIIQQFSRRTSPPSSPIIESVTNMSESVTKPDCKIKGNISQNSGKKYYHVPGMEDYESTVIEPNFGEKWFCTEQEAISNGWVKALN